MKKGILRPVTWPTDYNHPHLGSCESEWRCD